MKATIDIPDELYRRVKAQAALDGRAIRDVAIELFTEWVGDELPTPPASLRNRPSKGDRGSEWLARWLELGAEIEAAPAIDPRPVSEIIRADRR
jgi:hypothetical protein